MGGLRGPSPTYRRFIKGRADDSQTNTQSYKEKQPHSKGGTYDNWITLYIAKAVKGFKTDDEINQELGTVEDMNSDNPYTEGFHNAMMKKIEACRREFDIPCVHYQSRT